MKTAARSATMRRRITTFKDGKFARSLADIVREVSLDVFLNGEKIVTIACAGIHLGELAVGYLRSEGIIGSRRDLKRVRLLEGHKPEAHVTATANPERTSQAFSIASSGARGRRQWEYALWKNPLPEPPALTPHRILNIMDQLLDASHIHEATRGTHCSGLAGQSGKIITREDIGRHNTIDMLGGYMLLRNVDPAGRTIVTTGRISSEIVAKVARMGMSAIVSHSAPTSKAITLCRSLGMMLVGYVRDESFRVYAGHIKNEGKKPRS